MVTQKANGTGHAQVVPVALYSEGTGGIRERAGWLEALTPAGQVIERTRPYPDWEATVDDYRICEKFPRTLWYIGKPFSHTVRLMVDWKQNGYECAGELSIPGISPLPFGWEVVVSYDGSLFKKTPAYIFDVAFPWEKVHDAKDIVLRRRIAEAIERFVCAGQGSFKVSKHQATEVEINNFFEGRPVGANRPPLATCFPDLFTARKRGETTY